MRKSFAAIAASALIGLTGCGNDEDADMPDVEGQRLDMP